MPALVITTEGDVKPASVPESDHLAWMYETIQCSYVEALGLPHDQDIWMDEEGAINGKPVNVIATLWARYFGGLDVILHGDVILAKHDGPETVELSDREVVATMLTLHRVMDMAIDALSPAGRPDGAVIVPVDVCPN